MQRLDLLEGEDQLLYDLEILTQLRLQIDVYSKAIGAEKVPRWERARTFFPQRLHALEGAPAVPPASGVRVRSPLAAFGGLPDGLLQRSRIARLRAGARRFS